MKPRIWWKPAAASRPRSGPTCQARETAAFVDAAEDRLSPIGIFANKAGIEGVVAPLHEYPEDVFDRLMQVNVKASSWVSNMCWRR
jgi:NAD(P)-dependent dehydrogenase (short-subunit alcohol dehydrogenase family)